MPHENAFQKYNQKAYDLCRSVRAHMQMDLATLECKLTDDCTLEEAAKEYVPLVEALARQARLVAQYIELATQTMEAIAKADDPEVTLNLMPSVLASLHSLLDKPLRTMSSIAQLADPDLSLFGIKK